MLTEEIRTFLQKPLLARMSTLDSNGYPHTVPVWFMLDGDDLVVISVRETVKIKHLTANPKGSIVIGGEPGDGGGFLFKGIFSIEEDPDDRWMKTLTYRYQSGEEAETSIRDWTPLDIILLRLKVEKISKV